MVSGKKLLLVLAGIFFLSSSVSATIIVNMTSPSQPVVVGQNQTFWINASVTCQGVSPNPNDCGTVNGTARYNASSASPDTAISSTTGDTPFYVVGQNPKTCSQDPLPDGATCLLNWSVNATGSLDSIHTVDVNFSATNPAESNATDSEEVTIVNKVISLVLDFTTVDFGTVIPGTEGNSAPGNTNAGYNVSLDASSTVTSDLWINATDLIGQSWGGYSIGVSNVTWNDTENTYAGSTRMSTSPGLIRSGVQPGTVFDMYFWADIPLGIASGIYNGTMWVTANETG